MSFLPRYFSKLPIFKKTGLRYEEIAVILICLKDMMIAYKGYWNIISQPFKIYYHQKFYPNDDFSDYHLAIAQT